MLNSTTAFEITDINISFNIINPVFASVDPASYAYYKFVFPQKLDNSSVCTVILISIIYIYIYIYTIRVIHSQE